MQSFKDSKNNLKTWIVSNHIQFNFTSLVTEKELQKLYKNFAKIDKDKSGTLEPHELFDIPGNTNFSYLII